MNESSNSAFMHPIQQFQVEATSLLVYRDILSHPVSQGFLHLLAALCQQNRDRTAILNRYGEWFFAAAAESSWSVWVEQRILTADNPLTQRLQHQALESLPAVLVQAAQHDLAILQRWATLGPQLIQSALTASTGVELPLPVELNEVNLKKSRVETSQTKAFWAEEWSNPGLTLSEFVVWPEALPSLAHHYQLQGVGLFAQYGALRWRGQALEGIEYPDPIHLETLIGYPDQQSALKQNTEALLAGQPALNVLLYGSRGSGKSALIKGLLTAYRARGLRLIELSKAEMIHLPQVVEALQTSCLKFVIFVDDLSFEEDEESYKALKVVLEGSLMARPQNVVVYATSNRRHLIREFFGDRPRASEADEVHSWDTVQEKLSLSDRFGLTLTFEPANQDTYLEIVRGYAQQFSLEITDEDLSYQALQWAVRHNVRSGRTARQFIDHLRAQLARQSDAFSSPAHS